MWYQSSAVPNAIKGHPKGLYVLFFSEAWERFSFYGMRALLVLYLTSALDYERAEALRIYATYGLLVYLTPVLGGFLADRYLGARKAIIIGGVLMAVGHLAMAFDGFLFVGMGLIIAGNGFFKPNVSTIVGSLYEENDPRRDGGFTIFYMGINLGAMLAPLVCGTLGEKVDWHWGFSAATVGMILGLGVFLWGQRYLGAAGFPPTVEATAETRLGGNDWRDIALHIGVAIGVVLAVVYGWPHVGSAMDVIGWQIRLAFGAAAVGWVLWKVLSSADGREEFQRLVVILIICVMVIFFWTGFEQAGGTMNLFAKEQTDLTIPFTSWELPASVLQAINPFFIICLAIPFAKLWAWNDKSRSGLSTPAKMGVGMILLGLGFIIMYFGQSVADSYGKAGMGWLISVYLLHTMGELCLSPIGLSLVTKLSPPRTVSLVMGIWFAATALSEYLAGRLEEMVHEYDLNLWAFLIASSIGAGVVLLAMTPLLKKWMHGRGVGPA